MWEELGFYEGFALVMKATYTQKENSSRLFFLAIMQEIQMDDAFTSRAMNHINQLLSLISQFPTYNPTPTGTSADEEIDLGKRLSQIRARYKALCGTLGVKPRLAPGAGSSKQSESFTQKADGKASIWELDDNNQKPPTLSY